jgi:hypothetical protein
MAKLLSRGLKKKEKKEGEVPNRRAQLDPHSFFFLIN